MAKATGTPEILSDQVPTKPKIGSTAGQRKLRRAGGEGPGAYPSPSTLLSLPVLSLKAGRSKTKHCVPA